MARRTSNERPHPLKCAEELRLRALIEAGEPDEPAIELLHAIAKQIGECCGHNLLKAHRLAWGWTVDHAVDEFHAMCRANDLGALGLVARSWLGWEAGGKPNDTYRDLLCRLFQTSGVRLGFASDYTPAKDASADARLPLLPSRMDHPVALDRPTPDDVSLGPAAEALEFTRRAEASDLGPQTLEHLAATIDAIAAAFPHTPPVALFPQVRWYRQQISQLLEGQQTLRERRDLFRNAGWLSVILGWLSHDLGDAVSAEAYCLDAWEHGWQSESGEICAWSMDTAATVAMYTNRPAKARDSALKGLSQAPESSAAAVRLSCQLARAYGRLGNRDDFEAALRTTRDWLDALPERGSGLFSADSGRLSSYAATSSLWLECPADAVRHAEDALAFYASTARPDRSPTREAISRLDLALALLQLDSADGAVQEAMRALETDRLTGTVLTRAGELDSALVQRCGRSAIATGFHDRYEMAIETHGHPQLNPG